MGHSIISESYCGKTPKEKVIEFFLDGTDELENVSKNDFKEVSIDAPTIDECFDVLNTHLDRSYWDSKGIVALVSVHDEKAAREKVSYIKLQSKILGLNNERALVKKAAISTIKQKKTKKCPSCSTSHSTEYIYAESCKKCGVSLFAKSFIKKIDKIKSSIEKCELSKKEIIMKQKKKNVWVIGFEYHS